jgi:hypothetical protein
MISKEEALESLSKLGISITEEWNNKYDGISHYKRIKQYLTSSPLDICKDCLDKDNCISQEDCLDNDIEQAIEYFIGQCKQINYEKGCNVSLNDFEKQYITTITTALRNKDNEIATFKRRAKSHRLKAIEFNTKLDKIMGVVNKTFMDTISREKLLAILGDDSNE